MSNKVINAGVWYTISNFLVKGITFLTMPFFTRLMCSKDVGQFANIQSWFSILAIITSFELYSSVSIAQFDYKKELNSYLSSVLFLGSVVTSCFYLIVILFNSFFIKLFEMDMATIHIIFIYLIIYPATQLFQISNQIRYNYRPTIFVSVASSITSTMVALLLVYSCQNKLEVRIYGTYIPLIITSFALYVYIMAKGKSISRKYWKYALAISFPLIWHLLAANLLNSSDRIMISHFRSSEETALYSVSYSCAMVVALLWMSMNGAWSPWAYQKMDAGQYDKLKLYSKPYTLVFLIVIFGFMLFAPEILMIMGGSLYMSAVYVIPPVMVGYVFQFLYSFYVNIEFYHKKQSRIAFGTIIASLVNIGLNYLLIGRFGYIAAAYTTLFGYGCLFVIHYAFVYRLNASSWYDTTFFYKTIACSFCMLVLATIIYDYAIIRYSILLCLIVGCSYIIFNKNKYPLFREFLQIIKK